MPQIRYEFVATGQEQLLNTIKAVDRAANQAARSTQRAAGAATGRGAPGMPGAPTAKGYKNDPQMDAYWKASVKAAEQQGRAMQKEHERQYREKERHNARMAAAEKKATAKRVAEHEKAEARTRAVREREAIGRERAAAKEYAKQKAAHDKEIAAWRKKQEAFRESARESAAMNRLEWKGAAIKGVRGAIGGGIAGLMGLATMGVGAGVNNIQGAVRGAMALQEQATRTAINARGAGDKLVDPQLLMREFQSVAVNTPGITAEEVTDAVQKFVTLTGDLSTGRKAAQTFATVASATGSNVGDVSQASASISNQFGLKTDEEIKDVLTALTFQGKQGAFELADAASQFQRLAAAGAAFGLTGSKGVKTIGGLAQIARTGTGSAEQTTTAIENIFSNLTAKSAILKREGVDVYDKKTGKAREVTDVLVEAITKVGGTDFEKKSATLRQVFGDQGIRGILPLLNKFQTAYNETQGTEAQKTAAGMKRLREEFEKSINAPGTWEELQKDAATQQATMSAQVTRSYEQLKMAAAEQLAPAILQMVPTFTALIGASAALLPAIESMTKYLGYGVQALQEAGIIEGMEMREVKRNKPKTLGEAVQRRQEILDAGAPTANEAAEMAELDKFIATERIRVGGVDELQKRKDEIYGKGGTLSAEDEATVDLIDKTLAERGKTDFQRYAEQDPFALKKMTAKDFEDEYVRASPEGADLDEARLKARMFAGNVARGQDTSEMFMRGGLIGMANDEESEEQRAVRARYKTDHAEAVGPDRITSAIATIVETMTGVSLASENAARALNKLGNAGQPSITGAPAG